MSLPKDYKVCAIEGELCEVHRKTAFDVPSVEIIINLDSDNNTFQLTDPAITALIKSAVSYEPGLIAWIETEPIRGGLVCAVDDAQMVEDALRIIPHVTSVYVRDEIFHPKVWVKITETPETQRAIMNGFVQMVSGEVHIIAVHFASDLIKKNTDLPLHSMYPADAYIIPGTNTNYEHPIYVDAMCSDTLSHLTPAAAIAAGLSSCREFTALYYTTDVREWVKRNCSSQSPERASIPIQ